MTKLPVAFLNFATAPRNR